jgi:hypothetical protein
MAGIPLFFFFFFFSYNNNNKVLRTTEDDGLLSRDSATGVIAEKRNLELFVRRAG